MAERRIGWGGHSGVMMFLVVSGALLLAVSAQQQLKLKVGSDVTLVPVYTGDPSEINWKINSNKLVDMELKPQVDFKFYRLEDRATIRENGSLTIKNLTIGDSGDYKAEALVNNVYQNTERTLIVLDCPDQPTITEESTKDRIVLSCHSSTPGVTYEWQTKRKSVIKNQLYNESRPQEDVTLTCFVDNEVCKKNVSITISYIPDPSGSSGWIIALIIIVILLIYIIAIAVLYYFRENDLAKRIFSALTCYCCCGEFVERLIGRVIGFCCNSKNKGSDQRDNNEQKQEGHNHRDNEQGQEHVPFIEEGGEDDVEEGIAATAVDEEVDSDSCGSISLNLSSTGTVKRVMFQKDVVPSIDAEVGELNGQPQRIISLRLTVNGVETEDHGDYTAEALLSNGEILTLSIEGVNGDVARGNAADEKVGNDEVVINKSAGNQVTFTIPDTQKVKRLFWKRGGTTLFEWAFLGVQLRANNIILQPGSVTVNDLKPRDSGFYEIEVHSTDNSITKNAFQLEVVKQVDKSKKNRKIQLKVKPPENGHPENQPIGSITFHPIKMSNKTEITWKKGDQPLDINGERIRSCPNGYLTINDVTHKDQGEYTVHCEDQELKQEFILRL